MDRLIAVNSSPTWLRVLAICVFLASLAVNGYFSHSPYYGNAIISANYPLQVTPPGFTFSVIWPLIYVLLAATLIYVAWYDLWNPNAYYMIIGISILSAIWMAVFGMGRQGAITACLFILLAMVALLYTLWKMLEQPFASDWTYTAVRNIISLYLGWVIAAFLLNLGIVLVYFMGVSQHTFTIIFWILLPLIYLAITFMVHRSEGTHGVKSLIGLWAAGLWAIVGAAIATSGNKGFW